MRILEMQIAHMAEIENFCECLEEYKKLCNKPVNFSKSASIATNVELENKGLAKGALLVTNELKCVGFVGVVKIYDPHANACFAYCDSIFCLPSYRRQGGGKMLIDEAKRLAKILDADGLIMSAPYGSRLAKVYERTLKPLDVTFWLDLGDK